MHAPADAAAQPVTDEITVTREAEFVVLSLFSEHACVSIAMRPSEACEVAALMLEQSGFVPEVDPE